MTDITATETSALVKIAEKRLRRHIDNMKNIGSFTAAEREQKQAEAIIDLARLGLYGLGKLTSSD